MNPVVTLRWIGVGIAVVEAVLILILGWSCRRKKQVVKTPEERQIYSKAECACTVAVALLAVFALLFATVLQGIV